MGPRKCRGISPLISTTMLVLIAITLSIMVSSWLTGMSKTETGKIQNRTQERLLCERGYLTITSVTYNCSNDCRGDVNHAITLGVRNTGEIRLGLEKIYLLNNTRVTFILNPNVTSLDISEIRVVGNISRESCSGINNSINEVIITTSCPNVYDTFLGSDVVYQNC